MNGFVNWLYGTSVWQMGAVVTAIMVGSTLGLLVFVDRTWSKELRKHHNDIVGFLIAVVGIIYAILISSLAIPAMNRQDRASAVVLREADTVAGLVREQASLPSGARDAFRAHLLAYLDAVINREWPEMRAAKEPTAGDAAADQLWEDVARLPVNDFKDAMIVTDLRRHIDVLEEVRRDRAILATSGVDRVVWGVVLFGSAATILFAILFGAPHFAAHVLMTALFAFTIALAIVMIIAIDWPFFGEDAIGPEPLVTLRSSLVRPPTAHSGG